MLRCLTRACLGLGIPLHVGHLEYQSSFGQKPIGYTVEEKLLVFHLQLKQNSSVKAAYFGRGYAYSPRYSLPWLRQFAPRGNPCINKFIRGRAQRVHSGRKAACVPPEIKHSPSVKMACSGRGYAYSPR